MDQVLPRIVLGIDHGPDHDTVAVCAVDPDTGAVTLVDVRRIGHDEEPNETADLLSATRVELCNCGHGVTITHPRGSTDCIYEENR